MLQKLFVSYQLRADPLRKEWLLAAPALQGPATAGRSRCAKDQTAAVDTHPAQGLRGHDHAGVWRRNQRGPQGRWMQARCCAGIEHCTPAPPWEEHP